VVDKKVKIAGLQMDPKILEKERNLARCLELIELTAKEGARLVVLPECALTGYCFTNLEEALPVAELIPGPSTGEIMTVCCELNVYVTIGLLEKDGDRCYNTAVLLGPHGLVGKHRKLHLPYVGIDRFVDPGDLPLTVYNTEVGRIGMGICYDLMFAEHSRVLALQGADILVFPANWPQVGKVLPDYILPTRAIENHVFCVAVNRNGTERGVKFPGRSKIVHWFGRALAEGKRDEEDILYAEIEPAEARQKRYIIESGEHEVDFINDRRPEYYDLVFRVSPTT
jgi:predicted amidohydrolase